MTYSPTFDKVVTTETVEGQTSAHFIPGHVDIEVVHLDIDDIALATDFMLVDLSDTTNWPHTTTGHIDIAYIIINVSPSTAFAGDLEIGFLSAVDATNGDFHGIAEWHLDQKVDQFTDTINFGAFELSCELAHWFGPTTANDTAFQTDVNLQGPDGATSYPSGAGDLVVRVSRTAGNMSAGITIGYRTHA